MCVCVCVPTNRKTLLSGLTLCFSMYLIKLLFAYLKHNNIHKKNQSDCVSYFIRACHHGQIISVSTHVVLLKSFCSVGYSGIFLMSSQSLSVKDKSTQPSSEFNSFRKYMYMRFVVMFDQISQKTSSSLKAP